MVEFKFSDFFYPADLTRTLWLLWRSERWRPDQHARYQGERLAALLRHCAEQVPYYRSLFRELEIDAGRATAASAVGLLHRLPVLDKQSFRAHATEFTAADAARYNPKPITTSGTTGTPLTVLWDRGSNVLEMCSMIRLWRWAGYWPGQSFLDLRSRPMIGNENHLVVRDGIQYIYNPLVRALELSSDLIDPQNLRAYYQVLLRYRPGLVRGHPRSIAYLASLLHAAGLDGWRPRVVTTASEALYDFQRDSITAAWGVPVLDNYGLKEHNVFIAQCREGGYHVFPEYGICEILDDDGRPVRPGEEGWIVATGLHNYAQPLLRYNTLDRAVSAGDRRCPCGRGLPLVQRIVGRIDDCLETTDGHRYTGLSFAFFGLQTVRQARLTQEDLQRVTVEVVPAGSLADGDRAALLSALDRKVEGKLRFDLKLVEQITQESPGKFKFVVSRLKQES